MVSFYGLDDGLYRERIVFCTETIIGITGFLTKNTHVGQKILKIRDRWDIKFFLGTGWI